MELIRLPRGIDMYLVWLKASSQAVSFDLKPGQAKP